MKNSMNFSRHRLHSTFNFFKLSSKDIFLSLKNKKLHLYKIRFRLPWMLVIFAINYRTNFMIFEMNRPHMMFSGSAILSVLVCYARILPTTIQTSFSNITCICHNIPLLEWLFSSFLYQNEGMKSKES